MIDQLFQMLMLLINHKKMKAADIAERLGVSVKSVMRYLDTLSLSGIPVIADKGRNGGIKLGEEFIISRNYFSSDEIIAIQQALINNSTNSKQNTSIALKLNSINQEVTLVDNSKIINLQSHDLSRIIDDKINIISKCLQTNNTLEIRYFSRDGKYTKRAIIPLTFLVKDGEWYIYCYCLLRCEYRTFKLTRISHIFIAEKHNFDLTNYPKLWNLYDEDKIELKLNVTPKGTFMIIDWLGVEALSATENSDEILIINTVYSSDLIYKLLSFGDAIKILSPQKVIDEYNKIVKNIVDNY